MDSPISARRERTGEFRQCYQTLVDLAAKLGVDILDDSLINVSSVQTNEGPGLRVVLTLRLDDFPGADVDGTSQG